MRAKARETKWRETRERERKDEREKDLVRIREYNIGRKKED